MAASARRSTAHPNPSPRPSPRPSPNPHPNPGAKPKPKPKPNLTAGRLPQLSDERVRPAGQYKTPALGRAPGPLDCLLAPGPKWAPGPLDAREASLRAAPPVDPLPSLYIRAHHGSLCPARRADSEPFCLWPCTLQARLADAEREVQHALRDRARPVPRRRRREGQGALNSRMRLNLIVPVSALVSRSWFDLGSSFSSSFSPAPSSGSASALRAAARGPRALARSPRGMYGTRTVDQ